MVIDSRYFAIILSLVISLITVNQVHTTAATDTTGPSSPGELPPEIYTSAPRFYPNGRVRPLDKQLDELEMKDPLPTEKVPQNLPPPNLKIYDSEGNTVQTYYFHTTAAPTKSPKLVPTTVSPVATPKNTGVSLAKAATIAAAHATAMPPVDPKIIEAMVKEMMAKMSGQTLTAAPVVPVPGQPPGMVAQPMVQQPMVQHSMVNQYGQPMVAGQPMMAQQPMAYQQQMAMQQPMYQGYGQSQVASYGQPYGMGAAQPGMAMPQTNSLTPQQMMMMMSMQNQQQPLVQQSPMVAPHPVVAPTPNQNANKQVLLQLMKTNPQLALQMIKAKPQLLTLLAPGQGGASSGNSEYKVVQVPADGPMPVSQSQMVINGKSVGQVVGVVNAEIPQKPHLSTTMIPMETEDLAPDESETRSPADYENQAFADKMVEVQSSDFTPAPSLENSEFLEQVVNDYARDRPVKSKPHRWRKPHLLVKAAIRKLPPAKLARAKWLKDPPPEFCIQPIVVHDECDDAQARKKPARRWSYQLDDGTCYLYEDPCPDPSRKNSFEQLSQCIASCWRQTPDL